MIKVMKLTEIIIVNVLLLLVPYRSTSSPTEGDHKMVVTSSNAAYGVVSVSEHHQYEVIGPQTAQHSSATDPSHQ